MATYQRDSCSAALPTAVRRQVVHGLARDVDVGGYGKTAMRRYRSALCVLLSWVILLAGAKSLSAHPMGNFSINHYTRLVANSNHIAGVYILDVAEIPTVTEMSRLDSNQDGVVSDSERVAYLREMSAQLSRELSLTINEQPVVLKVKPQDVAPLPGAGGLKTLRITLNLTADFPASALNLPLRITYKDTNYPVRAGWKEIIVSAADTANLHNTSVPATDLSKELTVYPADPSIAPPQVTEAQFTVIREQGIGDREHTSPQISARASTRWEGHNTQSVSSFSSVPRDPFTQSIAMAEVTPMLMALALLSAFGFGALHALSPGHGKAMVAAYLIGTRGTAYHAVLLGLVVTLTHTVGVFALGLITLLASRWIVPDRLYPIISGLSGLAVAGMGAGLLWHRLRIWRLQSDTREEKEEVREEGQGAAEATESAVLSNSKNGVNADLEEFYTQRRSSGSVSLRTLIGLGITGGALPCPSALVVMLSAIALHRTVFGLLLIVAFSLGLAVVLTVLGLLVMRARGLMERVSPGAKWMPGLSVFSAGVVTIIGLLLVFRSLTGRF